eukprot:TRINITY_DN23665_c0_g1_i1.p2 TRINITY_DN23665_c0_g1~~TRINITY_DN23665_c0_g1_i1.p2  ORF type:complete len:436 (+),score=91.61 TRINITY_DN23665_c0_g1_i1:77-1309(+)
MAPSSLRATKILALAGAYLRDCLANADFPSTIEIQFEPIDGSADMPGDLLNLLGGGPPMGGPHSHHGAPSTHGREAVMDEMLTSLLSGGPPPGMGGHGHGGHAPEILFGSGPLGGTSQIIVETPDKMTSKRSAFPVEMFRDLFPGPLELGAPVEHPTPFSEPDPFVHNLLRDIDKPFLSLMSDIQKTVGGRRLPNSCVDDLKTHCQAARSQLHCLGQHADVISAKCSADVGKSVPFRCSNAIDQYCDVLQDGILDCLGKHVSDLPDRCKDAVLATHHVISKANTQKAAVVETSSGAKRESVPSGTAPMPAALPGAIRPSASAFELPAGVSELLGLSVSIDAKGGVTTHMTQWGAFLIIAGACLTSAFMCQSEIASSGWLRKLRAFTPYGRKAEGEQLLRTGVELPKPVDA